MRLSRPIKSAVRNGVLIIRVQEYRVVFPKEVARVGMDLRERIASEPPRHVVINLEPVRYLSSSALGLLVQIDKIVKGRGQRLRLCGLNPQLRESFEITHLDMLLEIRDSEAEACDFASI